MNTYNVAVAANVIIEADSSDEAEQSVSDAIGPSGTINDIIFDTKQVG